MTTPTPEEWNGLADRYLIPYINKVDKNQARLFTDSNNEVHNLAFNMLMANVPYLKKDGKTHKDFRRFGIVVHADKMLEHIQATLLKQGTVIQYQRNGKQITRNNLKWTDTEITQLRNLHNNKVSIRGIARRLGRSKNSAYQKLRNIGIKEGTWR